MRGRRPAEIGPSSGLNRFGKGLGQARRVSCSGHRRVDQYGVGSHFHGFTGLGREADTGVNHDGNVYFFDQDLHKVFDAQALVAADERSQRHDRRGPGLNQRPGNI